jgi:hypothetical protein
MAVHPRQSCNSDPIVGWAGDPSFESDAFTDALEAGGKALSEEGQDLLRPLHIHQPYITIGMKWRSASE